MQLNNDNMPLDFENLEAKLQEYFNNCTNKKEAIAIVGLVHLSKIINAGHFAAQPEFKAEFERMAGNATQGIALALASVVAPDSANVNEVHNYAEHLNNTANRIIEQCLNVPVVYMGRTEDTDQTVH